MPAATPEYLARLFDRHAAALELYAAQWTMAAEDVVQETFVRFATLDPLPDCPAAWLYRVVRNGAISAARADRRRKHRETVVAQETDGYSISDVGALDAATVVRALESLTEIQREIVVAHLWGGLTFTQVGELTETSSSTANRHYQAALQSLRTRLGLKWLTNDNCQKN